jgi:uncharacterized membrane protein
MNQKAMTKFKDKDMQLLLGQVLRAGTVVSISIVFAGGIFYLYRHGLSVVNYKTFKGVPDFLQHFRGIMASVFHLNAPAVMQLGIMLLIATPILRVAFSAIGFVLEKDYLYVGISLLVLFIIFMSMINGHAG